MITHWKFAGLAATLAVFASTALFAAEPEPTPLDQVKKQLAEKKAVLVDVREKHEWDAGHVDKATYLPMSELEELDAEELAKRLPKKRKLYTYCAAGFRAAHAAEQLAELGYRVEPIVDGGYDELVEAGFKKAPAKKAPAAP